MSFGWSVGDLVHAASAVWAIYESVGPGARSAKTEFAAFQVEFNLVKTALEKLQGVAATCPGEDLDLGKGFEQTLARCASFIKKHEALGKDAKGRRPSFQDKFLTVWDKVSWPLERNEAEQLRRYLERYVQIAILKVTANTRDVTRQLARASEQARLDHLEMLKAIKTMSVQVSSILRRCLPDGSPDDRALDVQYLSRLQGRHLSSLLDPWAAGLGAIPENDVVLQANSQATLDRIHEITEKLGYLVVRLDTVGRQATTSPERPRPLKRTRTVETIGSDTTIVAPVVDLLNQIGEEIREALDEVGYENAAVPGHQQSDSYHIGGKPTKVLNNAAEQWDHFQDWLQFQLVHSLEVHPRDIDLIPETWRQTTPEPPRLYTPPGASSPPRDPYPQRTLSPPRWPIGYDQALAMSRTPSSESHYDGSRSPLSIDSTWDRRSSMQSRRLTKQAVQVLFPDRHHANRYVQPPVTCHVVVYSDPDTNEPGYIEGISLESGLKSTHSLDRDRPSKHAESSMIPYVPHSGYSSSSLGSSLCIRFMGSHRVKIEQDGGIKKWHISPIYVCHDKKDFDMFQNTLLQRQVLFCGDVTRIHSSRMGDHCSQETVRVLEEPVTGTTSILYFASRRGSSNVLPGFHDCPEIIYYPVSDFSPPQKAGKRDVRLHLLHAHRDARGISPRRNSVESTSTTVSHESRASRASIFSSTGSDTGWRKEKEKWLQFDFQSEQGSEAFIMALQHKPR
ncbi:hypothetical protein BDW59DRAFT_181683 [Aspergillus cavernicola]|uniref:Fungal N-terminal domain-containing protein n=1 Tax=Aspergillus cavernicola TaxID=176166 RepID=A0ABR4HV43_9EURO